MARTKWGQAKNLVHEKIKEAPRSIPELAEVLQLPRSSVWYDVKILLDEGKIEEQEFHGQKIYCSITRGSHAPVADVEFLFCRLESGSADMMQLAAEEFEAMAHSTMIPYRTYVEKTLKIVQNTGLPERVERGLLSAVRHMVRRFKEHGEEELLKLVRDQMDFFWEIANKRELSPPVRNLCLGILAEAEDERAFDVAYHMMEVEPPEVMGMLGTALNLIDRHIRTHRQEARAKLYRLVEKGDQHVKERAREYLARTRDWGE